MLACLARLLARAGARKRRRASATRGRRSRAGSTSARAIRALYAARGGPPAGARVDESEGDDDSDGDDEDSDDGDSSIEAILAEAVERLRS